MLVTWGHVYRVNRPYKVIFFVTRDVDDIKILTLNPKTFDTVKVSLLVPARGAGAQAIGLRLSNSSITSMIHSNAKLRCVKDPCE